MDTIVGTSTGSVVRVARAAITRVFAQPAVTEAVAEAVEGT